MPHRSDIHVTRTLDATGVTTSVDLQAYDNTATPAAVSLKLNGTTLSSGGVLTFGAGSATAGSWPAVTAGTVLTTPAAGVIERDSSVFYITNAASQRGVLPSVQFVYQSAAFTLTNGTSAQNAFTAASDTMTVRAATTYLFECYLSLTTGATDHITSVSFDAGTATFTSFNYHSSASSAAANTLAAAQQKEVEVSTVIAVTATSTAVRTRVVLLGSFQVNAAGTFIPRITFSADPTGTCTTNIGSYFRVIPIGTNTVVSAGPWA